MEVELTENRCTFQGMDQEEVLEAGELFLNSTEAMAFTDFCDAVDFAIIGIEGGYYDAAFVPSLDLIEDYSMSDNDDWNSYRKNCNKKSRVFLARFINEDKMRFYLTVSDTFEVNKS